VTGRRVAIAPRRAERPGAPSARLDPPTPEELEQCPFCAGHEDRTPPETLRIGDPWRVRVMPNLYPAFERQEVVVHTPRHVRSMAELDDEELTFVAEAWASRRAAEPEGYLHALLNEGREAGASLPHTHSQLIWLPEAPPETQHGVDRERWNVVAERDGLVLACPWASRVPYELVIAPVEPRGDAFEDEQLPAALRLLGDAVRRVHRAAGAAPSNAWLHDSADWHVEVFPRLTIVAGVELGSGWAINPLAPEDAAGQLRD
jgi:UDPglucose--hexose-1-phosphate uridylyltransferase